MATTSVTGSAASAVPNIAKGMGKVGVAAGVSNMPTRAIAQILLGHGSKPIDHEELYKESDKSGLMRSHRHFKHCLRMMKDQNRVKVICLGPEKVGSAKRKFAVGLTRKGTVIYTKYLEGNEAMKKVKESLRKVEEEARGLPDAL